MNQQQHVYQNIKKILVYCSRNVGVFFEYLPQYKDYLYMLVRVSDQYSADSISKRLSAWENLTSDPEVFENFQ